LVSARRPSDRNLTGPALWFEPILHACGDQEDVVGMFYGNVWKKVIIDSSELWIGIRSAPTFPESGMPLRGKTYFLSG
jgi:hypothetical protein